MPVNATHSEYDANAFDWSRARDVLSGEDAVKSAGEKYLPRLDSQTDDEFVAYRKRASFFNATARSAEGFVGLIFKNEPAQEWSKARGLTPDSTTILPQIRKREYDMGKKRMAFGTGLVVATTGHATALI